MESVRVDVLLVQNGLASSRTRAQELIAAGRVFLIDGASRKPITKSSYLVHPDERNLLQVETDPNELRFVSRGGNKMRGALDHLGIAVTDAAVLDIGISTGGFTDCLLQAGARLSIGVDVGHGQLAEKLKSDPRVKHLEGVNARNLSAPETAAHLAGLLSEFNGGHPFDLVVVDVSFISLALVLPEAIQYLKASGFILALVKPQFEVGREALGKNGIVKDTALFRDVEHKIRATCEQAGLAVEDYFESSIEGGDGNREFFVYARPHLHLFNHARGLQRS